MASLKRNAAFIVLLAVFIYLLVFFIFADIEKVISRTPDDAAYYFKIAENIVAGNGSTFDGINRTNGYHPLWLVVLLPFAKMSYLGPEIMFRIYLILNAVIVFMASWLLFRSHAKIFPPFIGFFCSILYAVIVFVQTVNGMETGLVLLGIVSLFVFGTNRNVFSDLVPRDEFVFGILLGLTMLARLDMVWLGAAIIGFCLYLYLRDSAQRRAGIVRLVLVLSGATLVVAPYLVYNILSFGAAMPLSGILKSSFPYPSLGWASFSVVGKIYTLFALSALVYLPWAIIDSARRKQPDRALAGFRAGMVVLAAAVLLHFLHVVLFLNWAVFAWHFMPYAVLAGLVVSEPAFLLHSSLRFVRFKTLFILFGLVLLVAGSVRTVNKTFSVDLESNWAARSYRAAVWARDNTAPSDIFAMKDAGKMGYFSGRPVVNLDGVVNDRKYQIALKNRALNEYLIEHRVKYVVQHGLVPGDKNLLSDVEGGGGNFNEGDYEKVSLRYLSHLYGVHGDPVVFRKSGEVFREKYTQGNSHLAFVIWRYNDL